MIRFSISIFLFLYISTPVYAYLGPGVGGGVIVATLGIIVAIFAAIFALIWFPLKRLFNKDKKKQKINLINHFLILILIIFTTELLNLFKIKKIFLNNKRIYLGLFEVLNNKNISDNRKEELILRYSKFLFNESLKLLAIIILVFVFILLLNVVSTDFIKFLSSAINIIEFS